jgi:ATP-binding cassette, subfamily B, bacterial
VIASRSRARLVLAVAWSARPVMVVSLAVLGTLAAVGPLAVTLLVGAIVGSLPAAIAAGADSAERAVLARLLVVFAAVFLASLVVEPALDLVIDRAARRFMGAVFRRSMAATMAPARISAVELPEVRDDIARAESVGGVGPRAAIEGLVREWVIRLRGVAALAVLSTFRWWLGPVLLLVLLVNHRSYRRYRIDMLKALLQQTRALRRSDYVRDLALGWAAAKEIRIFELAGWLRDRFRSDWSRAMTEVWATRTGYGRVLLLRMGSLLVANVAAAMLIVNASTRDEIGIGAVVVYLSALLTSWSVATVSEFDVYVEQGGACVEAMRSLEQRAERPALTGARPAPALNEGMAVEHVSFTYPTQARPTLVDVSLALEAGRSLAVVGANGAGKTTLVRLLCGLYAPSGGCIVVDGIDLADVDPGAWQRQVAAMFQDFVRYPLTVRENIAPASMGTEPDHDQLVVAARRARALEIIEGLPDGWDTLLSARFPGGVDLSGGQWQRIALARAIAATAAGAPLLILDEPTAHLDVRAEAAFYDEFFELTAGVTTVVISHRVGTVRRADRIAVIEHGTVTGVGPHDEMLETSAYYRSMYETQGAHLAAGREEERR